MNFTPQFARAIAITILLGCVPSASGFEVVLPPIKMSERMFDQAVFGKLLADGARRKCGETLESYAEMLEKVVPLDPDQMQEMKQAGEIDIHRFFARFEQEKRFFQFGEIPRSELNVRIATMRTICTPLKTTFDSGLHGKGSLLDKVIRSTLDEEQQLAFEGFLKDRQRAKFKAYIKVTLASLDRRVPLTRQQREKITSLLIEKTIPPLNFGSGSEPIYKVLSRMAEIEDDLKQSIYSESEWLVIGPVVERGRQLR